MAQHRSKWTFVGALLLGIAVFALVLQVTGTRLDRTATPKEPSAQEVTRQQLAVAAQEISEISDDDVSAAASAWEQTLGGVWVPWPNGAPEGATNPPLPTTSPTDPAAALEDFSKAALATDVPAAISAGVSAHALAATQPADCGEPDLAALAAGASESSVAALESARQWMETDAAALPAGGRDAQLARIDMLSELIDSQIEAGAPDSRPAFAELPEGDLLKAAYSSATDQLVFDALDKDAAYKQAAASFVCQLYMYADAPEIPALPGVK